MAFFRGILIFSLSITRLIVATTRHLISVWFHPTSIVISPSPFVEHTLFWLKLDSLWQNVPFSCSNRASFYISLVVSFWILCSNSDKSSPIIVWQARAHCRTILSISGKWMVYSTWMWYDFFDDWTSWIAILVSFHFFYLWR